MDDNMNEKQSLLLQRIINQGYEPEEFQYFLENIKPGKSEDINAWTLEELQEATNQFIQNKTIEIDITDAQIITTDQRSKEFNKSMSCQLIQKTILGNSENLQVKIMGFTKINAGYFTSAYCVFNIQTTPQQWIVQRKYQDFIQLREILSRMNPGLSIPSISDQKSNQTQNDHLFIKHMDFFQRFLNYILNITEFLNNTYLEQFLSLSTEKDWQNAVKISQKMVKINGIDQVFSSSGEIPLKINQDLDEFFNISDPFVRCCVSNLKRARQLSKQLIIDLGKVQQTLFEIGEAFNKIKQDSIQYGQKTNITDFSATIFNMVTQWGDYIHDQRKSIDQTFSRSFKFTYSQLNQLTQLIQQRNESLSEYVEFSEKLLQKKQKLFKQDQSKWDIASTVYQKYSLKDLQNNKQLAFHHMLHKENYYCRELKNIFAFYNQRVYEQVSYTIMKSFSTQDFLSFSKNQAHKIANVHHLWADAITNFQIIHDQL